MSYQFFVSHARANYDSFLKQFVEQLSSEVRAQSGHGSDAVSFFERRDLEAGTDLHRADVNALQTSHVFLAMLSPAYFASVYCGKELEFFRRRIAAAGDLRSNLIKSVVWIPCPAKSWPPAFAPLSELQYGSGSIRQLGVMKLLLRQRVMGSQPELDDLILTLARDICTADQYHRPRPLVDAPALRELPSEFADKSDAVPLLRNQRSVRTEGTHPILFLCYRREDTSDAAGRLHDRLVDAYGPDGVFMDIDSVPLGIDFVGHVAEQIAKCNAVFVMIGKQWIKVKDKRRRRRLDNEDDLVRAEIATALQQKVPVIPVLVQDAGMPTGDELPENIRLLARRNGISLSTSRWRTDVERLIKELDPVMKR